MSQLSLFSADLTPPQLSDLGGLLAAHGQIAAGPDGFRLSIMLADRWRAEALLRECRVRDVTAEVVAGADERAPDGESWAGQTAPGQTAPGQTAPGQTTRPARHPPAKHHRRHSIASSGVRCRTVAARPTDRPFSGPARHRRPHDNRLPFGANLAAGRARGGVDPRRDQGSSGRSGPHPRPAAVLDDRRRATGRDRISARARPACAGHLRAAGRRVCRGRTGRILAGHSWWRACCAYRRV